MNTDWITFITRIASVFIALILGGSYVPIMNYIKSRTGISGRPALAVTYVLGTLGALALLWLIGVGEIGVEEISSDYILGFVGLVLLGNQVEYNRQKPKSELNDVIPPPQ